MGRPVGWVVGLVVAAACATTAPEPRSGREPLGAGLAALKAGDLDGAAALLADAARRYPVLADYGLYFQARAAARAGRPAVARDRAQRLLALHPDTVWRGAAYLLAGEVAADADDTMEGRDLLAAARAVLPPGSDRWARASLALAELEGRDGNPAAALDLVRELRRSRPRSLAARRARRLAERLRAEHPETPAWSGVEEAEMRLREGDAQGARAAATSALEGELEPDDQGRALWVRAQAEHALGLGTEAEGTCRTLAAGPYGPLGPRALVAAATWRWNADDDQDAIRLFREAVDRSPTSPQAGEALYAIGRIHQEHALGDPGGGKGSRRWAEAAAAFAQLAERFPQSPLASEARWRVGWVHYLAGNLEAAERTFRMLAERSAAGPRAAAEYWQARALERLGRDTEARRSLAHIADRHELSYYAALADERLGRVVLAATPPVGAALDATPAAFPAELEGAHAERARLLAELGLPRFARLELEALEAAGAPRRRLLEAYTAVGAPGAALRLAREMRPDASTDLPAALGRYLYPLGYWPAVEGAAQASGLDPLLVAAVIRQESLFDPDAVSPADARGLMQLLPATARDLMAGPGGAPDRARVREAIQRPRTNIELGSMLLARLLGRYGGSRVKALAAYNAGEDAVAKWERRYAGREPDEFVELISFRETRDYVKAVLRNHRIYTRLYAGVPPPSASARSAGSPPKAPFDITTMTSAGRAEATR
jgi:soluble lytic murein transglycosylase